MPLVGPTSSKAAVAGRAQLLVPALFAMLAFKNLDDREMAEIA
jgi:hypothetical protein